MYTKIMLIAFLLSPLVSFHIPQSDISENSNQGIQFADLTWQDALKKAKKENKILFVDVYATWCGPCKLLQKNTFPDKNLGDYFNQNFINLTYDGELGDGKLLFSQFKLRGYPTLLFIRPDGSIIAQYVGYHNAKELLEIGKSI